MNLRSPRRALLMSVGALVLVLAAAVVVLVLPPRFPRATFPDGTTVTLLGITYGEEKRLVGSLGQRLFYTFAPQAWKGRASVEILEGTEPEYYLLHVRTSRYVGDFEARLEDEHGCRVVSQRSGVGGFSRGSPLPHDDRFGVWTFPHDARRLSLIFSGMGRGRALQQVRMDFPNPSFRAAARWRPAPLPQTAAAGDLQVTLTSLVGTEAVDWPGLILSPQVKIMGPDAENWRPCALDTEDPAGNIGGGEMSCRVPKASPYVYTEWIRHHRAAKVKVTIERIPSTPFAETEIWRLRRVPIAGLAGQQLGWKAPGGLPVAAEMTYRYQHDEEERRAGHGRVSVRFTATSPEGKELRWTLLRVSADRPGPIVPERYSGVIRYRLIGEDFSAEVPAGTRFLDLDVAFHRPRTVEFLVPMVGER